MGALRDRRIVQRNPDDRREYDIGDRNIKSQCRPALGFPQLPREDGRS